MAQLVLASGSPRRATVLRTLGISFTVEPPDVDETPLAHETPVEMVTRLAAAKAGSPVGNELRLAVDTIVVLDHLMLGKPSNPVDAIAMLERLAGRSHHVISGFALASRDATIVDTVTSHVHFRPFGVGEAAAYVATGERLDKAGSYVLQGFGSRFVARIDGSESNVIGLPVETVVPLLEAAGIVVGRPDAPVITLRKRQPV